MASSLVTDRVSCRQATNREGRDLRELLAGTRAGFGIEAAGRLPTILLHRVGRSGV